MLGEFYFILLLQLDVVFDVLVGSLPWLLLNLFVSFIEFYLIGKRQLHNFRIRNKLLILVQIDLLEVGSIFMRRGYIRPNLVKAGRRYKGFDFIEEFLDFHVPWKPRIHLDC
jgi:hypothetical protein